MPKVEVFTFDAAAAMGKPKSRQRTRTRVEHRAFMSGKVAARGDDDGEDERHFTFDAKKRAAKKSKRKEEAPVRDVDFGEYWGQVHDLGAFGGSDS